ncbi:hypothetical protein D3C72_1252220 [compost metagenome]
MNSSVRSRRSAPCVAASALASRALARLPATSPTVGLNCPTAIRRWFWISCLSLMAFQYRARARSATRQLHGGARYASGARVHAKVIAAPARLRKVHVAFIALM